MVPIANGSEEMELVIIVDVLRRAAVNVVVASVESDLQVCTFLYFTLISIQIPSWNTINITIQNSQNLDVSVAQ